MPEIHVNLSAPVNEKPALEKALDFAREQLGVAVFTESKEPFAKVVLDALKKRDATLTVAESCTGGLIGDLLTDVPGSSQIFLGGFVAYGNDLKEAALGVPKALMVDGGVVSEPVVLAMADGAAKATGATYAIAVSGIAGPGGGSDEKPVGTTCMALIGPNTRESRTLRWPFDRRRNKMVSAYAALDLLRRTL
jgi:nicotinamide-nucleotide amidase